MVWFSETDLKSCLISGVIIILFISHTTMIFWGETPTLLKQKHFFLSYDSCLAVAEETTEKVFRVPVAIELQEHPAEGPSSTGVFVTQWFEHPTSITEDVGSIPAWNSESLLTCSFFHSYCIAFVYFCTFQGWCGWKGADFWNQQVYYNMCMPQRPDMI